MDLRTYQMRAQRTDKTPRSSASQPNDSSILVPLLGLAGEVGELVSEYKKYLRDGESHKLFKERVAEELGDLLWYLANVATKFGLELDEIADQNLAKCEDRWGYTTSDTGLATYPRPVLDAGFPEEERLPRRFEVELTTVRDEGSVKMRAFVNGVQVGNDLTDNAYSDDGYRFHDVFHLAYAAVLGWSPVVRKLLGRKRRSRPVVDEVEDGGRARVIEEGIAAMVFGYAAQYNYLEGVEGVRYDLLRTIKGMVSHLEVRCRSAAEWERAIMLGFNVWREMRRRDHGRILVDLDRGVIELIDGQSPVAG